MGSAARSGFVINISKGRFCNMATYNESLGGYVADVPRVVFRRCDKKAIYLDELSAATVSANIETTDINGGWSL